jgi:predicted nucleic acid-binding protein
MKQAVFVDTSAWLALINEADTDHVKAKTIRDNLLRSKKRFIVTDYIIVEIANSLCKTRWRSHAVKLINSIRETDSIEVVEIDKEILDNAWNMYSTRTDKEWSLTDCVSFVVMGKHGIREAFTNDRHFEQAGFDVLIKHK